MPERCKLFPAMNLASYFLILTFGICETGMAQIRWGKRDLEFHPAPSDTQIVAEFPFTNVGKQPVKIKSVKTSCGCTTATMDKEIYAPGEKGKISAIFNIGERVGVQEKTVLVVTNDPKEPELVLSFKAIIPKILEVNPIFLNWLKGEELKPKTVDVKVLDSFPVHRLDAVSSNPNMLVEVKRVEGGHDFKITVTPRKTGGLFTSSIEITPDFPKNPPKYFHFYTRVDD